MSGGNLRTVHQQDCAYGAKKRESTLSGNTHRVGPFAHRKAKTAEPKGIYSKSLIQAANREYASKLFRETLVMAEPIRILSAGAVKPGLVKVIDVFERVTSHVVTVTFATAPEISKRIDTHGCEIVIAPPTIVDKWVEAVKTSESERITIGRIGIGVMIRAGAEPPNIATTDEFRLALLRAESVIYNEASTGLYLERLFARLGIADRIADKTTRYPDAAGVLSHIATGHRNEIGFGATTVIIEAQTRGIKLVGPLPLDLQNHTRYEALLITNRPEIPAARQLFAFLNSPAAKEMFTAAGIQ